MPESGWRLGGRYTLLDQLGTGVGGTVWHSRDDQTGTSCAVKVLWPQLVQDEGALARLHATIAWIGQLNHPGIVAIEDVVSEDIVDGDGVMRVVALVTRLVSGESLRALLDRQGTMPAGPALLLAARLCDALDAARGVGVVHGDVKPSNILLESAADGGFTLRLTDFGMSALLNRAAMRSEQHALPAAQYIAPELGAGEAPTDAADVYAVGVVLYESLAGHPPVDPAGLPPGLPDFVAASLTSCLDENPQQRPAMGDLGLVLREAAAGADAAPEATDLGFAVPSAQAISELTVSGLAVSESVVAETILLPAPVAAPSRELVPRATTVVAVRNRRRARRRGNHVWVIGGAVVGGVATAAIIMFGRGAPGTTPDGGAGTTITPIVAAATPTSPGSFSPTGSRAASPTSSGSASPGRSAGSASPSTSQGASQAAAISVSASIAASSSLSPGAAASSPTVTPRTGRLYNAGAAACLDTSGGYFANGVVEQIWTCDNGVGQVFTLTASGQLTVDGGAYCLDDAGSSGGSGSKAQLWTCGGRPYQQWSMLSNGLITGRNSGLCLEVGPPGSGNGTQLELAGCDSQPHQQWSWD